MRLDQDNKTCTTAHPYFFFDLLLVFHNLYYLHLNIDSACFYFCFSDILFVFEDFDLLKSLKFIAGCHMREKEAATFTLLPPITRELDWTTQTFQAHVFFFLLFFSPMWSNPHVASGVKQQWFQRPAITQQIHPSTEHGKRAKLKVQIWVQNDYSV